MALGLLAGALAGGGEAVQSNARSRLDELKEMRLGEIRQKYQTSERVAGQEFAAEQNQQDRQFRAEEGQVDREFRAGESAADREQRLQLARMQESGANTRATAGRNDWQLVPMAGGGYGRYNPRTNQFEEANIPEGVDLDGGKLNDRQKAQLDMLSDQAKTLRDKQADGFELTTEERVQLGEIEAQQQAILGGGTGGDLASDLERTLSGEQGRAGIASEEPGPADEPQSERPGARGLLRSAQAQEKQEQRSSEHKRTVDDELEQVDQAVEAIEDQRSGGASGGLMRGINEARYGGGLPVDEQAIQQGQQLAERLIELHDDPQTSDFQRRQIMERLNRLRDSGVPLTIE